MKKKSSLVRNYLKNGSLTGRGDSIERVNGNRTTTL